MVLQTLDLNALAADVLHLYAHDGSEVALTAELDPDCPPIQGDAQQLRQVLHNLLQNAQDASEGRPARSVVLSTHWAPQPNQRVQLAVCDNGSGFPESILKRAFEPYVTTKAKGTGLGLAVVKKIIDEHGARIECSTAPMRTAGSPARKCRYHSRHARLQPSADQPAIARDSNDALGRTPLSSWLIFWLSTTNSGFATCCPKS